MHVSTKQAVQQFVTTNSYYPCCLLISTDICKLRQVVEDLPQFSTINISVLLSKLLVLLHESAYEHTVVNSLRSTIQASQNQVLILTEIDILFEAIFQLDPLNLFKQLSRQADKHLIVAWPGSYTNGRLAYAVPDHGRYQTWQHPEIDHIIQL